MAEPKPFASLSSSLLARKGQAKPAMRPQGLAGFGAMTGGHDDLGWNDMGYEPPRPSPIDLTPDEDLPPVLRERVELAEELEPAVPLLASKPRRKKAIKQQMVEQPAPIVARTAKAAFTLRLDPQRHLQLRLACAMRNQSAQQLVTEALDDFLGSIPEIDEIADRLPGRKAN